MDCSSGGIGNSLRPSVLELLTQTDDPYVCFWPMLSAPAPMDVTPPSTSLWDRGFGIDGHKFDLPEHSIVTSRTGTGTRGARHFALVCEANEPLTAECVGDLSIEEVENLRTGTRLGSSQVTSVVRYRPSTQHAECRRYQIRLNARLAPPYFVTLTDASVVPPADGATGADRWDSLRKLRSAARAHPSAVLFQPAVVSERPESRRERQRQIHRHSNDGSSKVPSSLAAYTARQRFQSRRSATSTVRSANSAGGSSPSDRLPTWS